MAHSTAQVRSVVLVAAWVLAGLLVGPAPAIAQSPDSKPQHHHPFEPLVRFFEDGSAAFREHLSRARGRFDELDERARTTGRGAVDAVTRLPNTRVVRGHQLCPTAANGAPDCRTAAARLCRERGFSTGSSVDFTSSEVCPPSAWASGRLEKAQCSSRTFITRAVCQ